MKIALLEVVNHCFQSIKRKKQLLCLLFIAFHLPILVLAQNFKVSLNYKEASLKTVLNDIAKQTSLSIVYSSADTNPNQRLSVKAVQENLASVMKKILLGSKLTYTITDNHIVLSSQDKRVDTPKKKITLRGIITDEKGEPLIGVSVQVKGTALGTITDFDGNFILQAVEGELLKISYVGYAEQVLKVSSKISKIILLEDTEQLDEVVVTALGIRRSQKALSYNVQELKSDELTTVKDANFMTSLSGKIAGVTINASSAGLGGATRVVMRGTKSIASNNNALYVIDGVPIFNVNNGSLEGGEYSTQPRGEGISDINPEDIESMSVLSGPAAAALYGSNAAQGVILITTKKGKEGEVSVTISNNSTFSNPFIMPEFQNTYGNASQSFKSWGNKLGTPSSYHPNDFFNTASNIQNTIALTAGSKNNQTYLSVGTTNANGLIPNNKYNRYNFNFRNTTSFLEDKMTLDISMSYILQNDQNMMAQGQYYNPLMTAYLYPRNESFDEIQAFERFDEGRNIYTQYWNWGTQGLGVQNPYWTAYRNVYGSKKNRYMLSASLKYQIVDWMSLSGRVRVDNSTTDFERKNYASTDGLFAGPKGFYSFSKSNDRQTYGDLLLNIDKRINDFTISVNLGGSGSYMYSDMAGFQGALKDMPNVFNYYNIDYKSGRDSYPLQEGYEEATFSGFVSAELGWKSMLYLTLTGRNDWASALAKTNQSSFFYSSVGLSAVISEMVDLPKAISYLKVRGSFASVGSAIPRGMSQPRYEWDPATGKWATNKDRPLGDLRPERTDSWEAGLSTKLFNNKINLEVTWYKSNTLNQTFTAPMSVSSGYSSAKVQTGNVQNTGMEFSLGMNNKWGHFNWESNVTFSFNNNKIIELVDNYYDVLSGTYISIPSSPQGGLGSLEYILTKGGTMGDIYAKTALKRDQEGNIWVDPSTKNVVKVSLNNPVKLGSVLPKSNLGFRNDFSYKHFNFGIMFAARFGGICLSPTQSLLDQFGVSQSSADIRDKGGVQVNNGVVDTEKYFSVVGGKEGILSEYAYSATNVRLQEASIGYSMPQRWFGKKVNMSIALVGRNLWMIYNKAPFDPQSTASTGTYYQGMDFFMQPSMRSYGFNVKFQF